MANRQIAQRQVTNVVIPQSSDAETLSTLGDTYMALEKKKDQANMMDFMSKAKVQMMETTNQWRIDNEADPTNRESLGKLNKAYDQILGQYTDKVGMLSRGDWAKAMNNVKSQYQMDNLQWTQKQTVKNVERRVNDSMQSSLTMFADLGSKGDLDNFYKEYEANKADIEIFSDGIMGDETRAELMKTYESDAMFSYLAGMARTDPDTALAYLDDQLVVSSINSPKKVESMRKMIKSVKSQKDFIEKENMIKTRLDTTMDILSGDYDITDVVRISNEIGSRDPKFAEAIIKSLENQFVDSDDEAFNEITKNIFKSGDKEKISEFLISALKDGRIGKERMMILVNAANMKAQELNKSKYVETAAENIHKSFSNQKERASVTEKIFKRFQEEEAQGEDILRIANEEIRKEKRVSNKEGAKYSVDQVVELNGYSYKVTGFDEQGNPLFQEL